MNKTSAMTEFVIGKTKIIAINAVVMLSVWGCSHKAESFPVFQEETAVETEVGDVAEGNSSVQYRTNNCAYVRASPPDSIGGYFYFHACTVQDDLNEDFTLSLSVENQTSRLRKIDVWFVLDEWYGVEVIAPDGKEIVRRAYFEADISKGQDWPLYWLPPGGSFGQFVNLTCDEPVVVAPRSPIVCPYSRFTEKGTYRVVIYPPKVYTCPLIESVTCDLRSIYSRWSISFDPIVLEFEYPFEPLNKSPAF
jgi:hypothetical protein